MPSEKQIDTVARMLDPDAFTLEKTMLLMKGEMFGHHGERVRAARGKAEELLTAAEQAEPAPAARSGAVKVKPLEWETPTKADTLIGTFHILEGRVRFAVMLDGISIPNPFRNTLDEAKAAAQADYERRILAALEQAEPATDAEREFNEVLKGAQEFNDALPERMRRNARDWLRPDDEPDYQDEQDPAGRVSAAIALEAFESCPDCAGSGYSNHPDSGQVCYRCSGQGSYPHSSGFTIMSKEDVESVRDKALEEAVQALSNKSAEAQETAGRLAEKLSGELKGRKKTANWRGEKTHRERMSFYYRKASELVLSLKSGGE